MTSPEGARPGPDPDAWPLLVRELRLSLKHNAGAYGYSVTITGCLAALSSYFGPPRVHEILLFAAGAVVSFALIESVATRGFTRSLRSGEESAETKVVALGSSLSVLSIGAAICSTILVGNLAPAGVGWTLGAFLGSVLYLLGNALEMTVARKIEEARGLR